MNFFRVGLIVEIEEEEWRITTISNEGIYGLRNDLTGAAISMGFGELTLAAGRTPQLDDSIRSLGSLSAAKNSSAAWACLLADHIRELVDGTPPDGGEPRAQYDLTLTKAQRYQTKLEELASLGHPMGERTLRRHVSDYLKGGAAELLDKRSTRLHLPLDGLADEVIALCESVLDDRVMKSSTTWNNLGITVQLEFENRWPDKAALLPAKDRIISVLQELAGDRDPTGSAKNRQSAHNSPHRVFDARPALLPGGEVQIDSSPFDVIVRMPDGERGRVVLTIMIDKATRSILATSIQRRNKGLDVGTMLADSFTLPALRPTGEGIIDGWTLRRMALPWAFLFDEEEQQKWDTARPAVMIQRLVTDNGRDYRGKVVEAACHNFAITLVPAASRTPTDKAIIESVFSTIKTRFLMHLPGQTGGTVEARGYKPETENLLTVEQLIWLFDRWITQVWQNTPTDGLRHPLTPSAPVLSPNAMYAAMFPFVGYVPMPLSERDYITLLPIKHRTIQKDGVQIQNRMYDSPVLDKYRLRDARSGGQTKWEVHYKPTDPTRIWVHLPDEDVYVTCHLKERRLRSPHAQRMWELAGDLSKVYRPVAPDQGIRDTITLIEKAQKQWRREEAQRKQDEEAEHLNEIQGHGATAGRSKLVPADDVDTAGSENNGSDAETSWGDVEWKADVAIGFEED